MLSTAARARLTIILDGARNPHNIGAAARALHDFGFSDLRIVNDFAAPFEAAVLETNAAVAAQAVMRNARRFDTLTEAIADCTLIIGTTAIGERELTQPVLTLQQASPLILQTLNTVHLSPSAQDRVALLFGSEKTGLTNDHLSHCHLLTTIPLFSPDAAADEKPARHLSMNLGQSVAVCLYELTRDGLEGSAELPVLHEAAATAADRERLTQLLLDVLRATSYTRRFPANATEPILRQLVLQLGTTHHQCETWMGILRQILWHNRAKPTTAGGQLE
jgi:TrmH family RNA methyltransferase